MTTHEPTEFDFQPFISPGALSLLFVPPVVWIPLTLRLSVWQCFLFLVADNSAMAVVVRAMNHDFGRRYPRTTTFFRRLE